MLKPNLISTVLFLSAITLLVFSCAEDDYQADFDASLGNAQGIVPSCVRHVDGEIDEDETTNGRSWDKAYSRVEDALSDIEEEGTECEVWVKEGSTEENEVREVVENSELERVNVFGGFDGSEIERAQRNYSLSSRNYSSGSLSGDMPATGFERDVFASNLERRSSSNNDGFATAENNDLQPANDFNLTDRPDFDSWDAETISSSSLGHYEVEGYTINSYLYFSPYYMLTPNSGTSENWFISAKNHTLNIINSPYDDPAAGNTRMRITEDGNVGIGSAVPDSSLHIDGQAVESGSTNGGVLRLENGSYELVMDGNQLECESNFYINNRTDNNIYMATGGGNVAIGTTDTFDNGQYYKLSVSGSIRADEIVVYSGWADFVFEDDYELMTLDRVEDYIDSNGHLPGVPSAEEIQKNGSSIGANQTILLQKIEELTLHIIAQQKQMDKMEKKLESFEK